MPEPIRVLMVEDDADHAELAIRELRRSGYQPDWTRVDTEAEFLAQLDPRLDLILSDYDMPQFSGSRALELLERSGLEIPFLIISGTIGEETAVLMMKLGAADYLLKDRLARLGPAVKQAIEQEKMRQERHRATVALRESEERFRQLAENIQEAFWIRDASGRRVLYTSPAYEKIWDRPASSLCDHPHTWIEAIHPEDCDRVIDAMLARLALGTYDEQYRIIRPDGTLRWVHDRAFPVRTPAGEVYRIVGIAGDITERKELEEQFRQSQKMEVIGQLAGGVAHDFNNILTIIQGQAVLAQADPSLSESVRGSVAEILDAANRAANLTRKLLSFSRKQLLRLRPLGLNDVISDLGRMLTRAVGPMVTLETKLAPVLPPIMGDQSMLEQILLNLAVNARDAMPVGGRLTISTFSASTGTDPVVGLRVTDTGTGISPEILPHIFEPFFTTKDVHKGTGLGLATVQGIVKQHRGQIRLTSEVGLGTTFELTFPATTLSVQVSEDFPSELIATGGRETILVVEDEPSVRALMETILRSEGYTVIETGSGGQALELYEKHGDRIDLLLTDMALSDGLTGKALAEELHRRDPGLRVVFSSGYGSEMLQDGDDSSEFFFLPKPFGPRDLARIVRTCLNSPAVASA